MSTRRPVAVVVGATSKWQADGRNTKLAHGKPVRVYQNGSWTTP